MAFPLFQSLFEMTKDEHSIPFPSSSQEFIVKHINDLDENGREIFYAIIRQDQIQRYPSIELPSCCKQMKSGLRIEFDKVPNHVKYMLYSFIEKHLQKINEDAVFFQQSSVPIKKKIKS